MPSGHNNALNGQGSGSNRYQRPHFGTTFAAPPPNGYPTVAAASLPHPPQVAQASQYTPPSCWVGVKQTPHLRCLVLTVLILLGVALVLAGAIDPDLGTSSGLPLIWLIIAIIYVIYGMECTCCGDSCGTTNIERTNGRELQSHYMQLQQGTP